MRRSTLDRRWGVLLDKSQVAHSRGIFLHPTATVDHSGTVGGAVGVVVGDGRRL